MNKKYITICSIVILLSIVFSVVTGVLTKPESNNKEEPFSGEVSLKSQEGNYSLNVTAVYDTKPDTDSLEAPEAQRVVVVVYEYTNADILHGLSITESHFKAYDYASKELELYPQKGLFEPSEVGQSGTFTASVAFALNNSQNYVKIEFYNDISSGKADAVFEETW